MKTWYLKPKLTQQCFEVLAPNKSIALVNLALFLGFLPDDKLIFSIKHNFKFYLKLSGQHSLGFEIVKTQKFSEEKNYE